MAANAETQRARDEAKQTVDSCNARIEELLRQQALEIRGRQLQVWGVRLCVCLFTIIVSAQLFTSKLCYSIA